MILFYEKSNESDLKAGIEPHVALHSLQYICNNLHTVIAEFLLNSS